MRAGAPTSALRAMPDGDRSVAAPLAAKNAPVRRSFLRHAPPPFILAAALVVRSAMEADFGKDVRPVLETYCFKCHGAEKHLGSVKLSDGADIAAIYRDVKTWDKALVELRDLSAAAELLAKAKVVTHPGDARKCLADFATRAFRRPVETAEVDALPALFTEAKNAGIRSTRRSVSLCGPCWSHRIFFSASKCREARKRSP